jgi:hypothetical protein
MKLAVLAAALLALGSTGCDRMLVPVRPPVYAAREEGLTLGFEDPTLEPGLRLQKRQQVRVKRVDPAGQALAVTKTFTSLSGQWDTQVLQKDGGVLLQMDHASGILLLPEGFPDRVSRWESRGGFNWVVGRATVDLPPVHGLEPGGLVGVWVESVGLGGTGPRTRTLYLPDIGEAETLTWIQGRWVTTNLLVSRGFTDVPSPSSGTTPGSKS